MFSDYITEQLNENVLVKTEKKLAKLVVDLGKFGLDVKGPLSSPINKVRMRLKGSVSSSAPEETTAIIKPIIDKLYKDIESKLADTDAKTKTDVLKMVKKTKLFE